MYVSIVIPVYNEVENIGTVVRDCDAVLEAEGIDGEIVVTDDGSRDGTPELLRQLAPEIPRLRPVCLAANQGQTRALSVAIGHAKGEVIVCMDGDGQNDPRDIPMLLARLEEGFDVVSGWRKNRKDAFLTRTLPSRVANMLIGLATGARLHDSGCSLKAYRADILRSLPLYSDMHRLLPGLCAARGARIAEVVVRHHPRRFGESKYGLSRTWLVALDILSLKMLLTFSSRPAVWFGACSIPAFVLGALCLVAAVFAGWPATGELVLPTLGFLFTYLGMHLLVMGLLGEAFVRHSDVRQREHSLPLAEGI